jgi:hypothetical protein
LCLAKEDAGNIGEKKNKVSKEKAEGYKEKARPKDSIILSVVQRQ